MTQEKQLLIRDLCARLPYGVKIHINHLSEENNQMDYQMELFDVNLECETVGVRRENRALRAINVINDRDGTMSIKPYLRPMSSMTEEEHKAYNLVCDTDMENVSTIIRDKLNSGNYPDEYDTKTPQPLHIDWLNAHHFDFRGLIPRGLAIAVTEENNPYKK